MACQGIEERRGSRYLTNYDRNIHSPNRDTIVGTVGKHSCPTGQGKLAIPPMVPRKLREGIGVASRVLAYPMGPSVSMGAVSQMVASGPEKADITTNSGHLISMEATDYNTVRGLN
jgi:hypothetical protein